MIRAAVIGCGRAGSGWDEWAESGLPRTHAGAYQHAATTELVALCDANRVRVMDAADRRRVPGWTNPHDMLAEAAPDLVSVCTPPSAHLDGVRAAIEAGVRTVLCEKPLAATLEDACEIVKLAEEAGATVGVMHHRRWTRPFLLPHSKHAVTEEVVATYSGGVLNNGTHALDFVRMAIGEIGPLISSVVLADTDDPEVGARFHLDAGGILHLDHGEFGVEAWGSWGRLHLVGGGKKLLYTTDAHGPSWREHDFEYKYARLRAIEQMARIAGGSDETPRCTIYDGLRAVELAYQAMGRKEAVA